MVGDGSSGQAVVPAYGSPTAQAPLLQVLDGRVQLGPTRIHHAISPDTVGAALFVSGAGGA